MEMESAAEAAEWLERLRSQIEKTMFGTNHETFHYTLSIGLKSFSKKESTPQDILEDADNALYEAKRGGRNKIVVWKAKNHGAR